MALTDADRDDFSIRTCGECGIDFGVPEVFIEARQRDHRTFYCPNGHMRHFPGETKEEKLERQLKSEIKRREWAQTDATISENRRRAQKGVTTKLKKRIASGQCPCCQKQFCDLKDHMAGEHPDYLEVQP